MSIDHLGEIRIIKQTVDTLVMTIAGSHVNGEHTIIIKKDEFIGLLAKSAFRNIAGQDLRRRNIAHGLVEMLARPDQVTGTPKRCGIQTAY